jgi:hypothetical protein
MIPLNLGVYVGGVFFSLLWYYVFHRDSWECESYVYPPPPVSAGFWPIAVPIYIVYWTVRGVAALADKIKERVEDADEAKRIKAKARKEEQEYQLLKVSTWVNGVCLHMSQFPEKWKKTGIPHGNRFKCGEISLDVLDKSLNVTENGTYKMLNIKEEAHVRRHLYLSGLADADPTYKDDLPRSLKEDLGITGDL